MRFIVIIALVSGFHLFVRPGNGAESHNTNHDKVDLRVIFFTQKGCLPCKLMEPDVIRCCKEKGIGVEIVDISDNEWMGKNWHIKTTPTTVYVDDNDHEVDRDVGRRDYNWLLVRLSRRK